MTNSLGQSQSGDSLYPAEGKGRLQVSFRPGKPSQLIRLMRLLATKWLCAVDGPLEPRELLTLSEGYFRLQAMERSFRIKHNELLEDVELIIGGSSPEAGIAYFLGRGSWPSWDLTARSLSGYFGEKGALSGVSLAKVIRRWRLQPPKPYVGRGYSDKGNRREASMDATPGWQEVASNRIQRGELPEMGQLILQETVRSRERSGQWESGAFQALSLFLPAEILLDCWLSDSAASGKPPDVVYASSHSGQVH